MYLQPELGAKQKSDPSKDLNTENTVMQSEFESLTFGKFVLIRRAQVHDTKDISEFSGLTTTTLKQNPIPLTQ